MCVYVEGCEHINDESEPTKAGVSGSLIYQINWAIGCRVQGSGNSKFSKQNIQYFETGNFFHIYVIFMCIFQTYYT